MNSLIFLNTIEFFNNFLRFWKILLTKKKFNYFNRLRKLILHNNMPKSYKNKKMELINQRNIILFALNELVNFFVYN